MGVFYNVEAFPLVECSQYKLTPVGADMSGNPAVWVKNLIYMQAAKLRICFLKWFMRYSLDWVSDNFLKHWFEQYGDSSEHEIYKLAAAFQMQQKY